MLDKKNKNKGKKIKPVTYVADHVVISKTGLNGLTDEQLYQAGLKFAKSLGFRADYLTKESIRDTIKRLRDIEYEADKNQTIINITQRSLNRCKKQIDDLLRSELGIRGSNDNRKGIC